MRLGEQKGAEDLPFHPLQLFPLPPPLLTDRQQKKEITDNSLLFSPFVRFPYLARKKRIKCEFSNLPHVGVQSVDYLRISSLAVTYSTRYRKGKPFKDGKFRSFFPFAIECWNSKVAIEPLLFSPPPVRKCQNANGTPPPSSCGYGGKRCLHSFPRKKEMPAAPEYYSFLGGYNYVSKYALFEPTQKQTIIISPHLEGKLGALHAPLLYELCRSSNTFIFLGMYL